MVGLQEPGHAQPQRTTLHKAPGGRSSGQHPGAFQVGVGPQSPLPELGLWQFFDIGEGEPGLATRDQLSLP